LRQIFLLNKYLSENLNPWYGSETVGPPVLIGRGGLREGGKTARKLQKMAPKGFESLARLQMLCGARGVAQAAEQDRRHGKVAATL
jgi:hypothetical protein